MQVMAFGRSMRAGGENQGVNHNPETKQSEQLEDHEAKDGNKIQRQYDHAADEHRERRMTERTRSALAHATPAQPGQHDGFAEKLDAEQCEYDKGHRRNP